MAVQSFDEVRKNDNQPFVISIKDKEYNGFFTNLRVNRETLPEGWYAYDLREDDDGDICELKCGDDVLVNFCGTFCTQNKLPLQFGESLYTYVKDFDYSFM